MMEETSGYCAAPSPLEYSRPRKREGEENRNIKPGVEVTQHNSSLGCVFTPKQQPQK
jgi:hypothetical protein